MRLDLPLLPSFHLLFISPCSVLLPLFTWLLAAAGHRHTAITADGGSPGQCFCSGGRQLFHNWVIQAATASCTCAVHTQTQLAACAQHPSHPQLTPTHPPSLQTNKLCSRNISRRHGAKLRVRTPPPLQGKRTKVAALGVAVFVSLMA